MENKPKWLWKNIITDKYQKHVTISTIDSTTESEDVDERIVYMEDLEKRKQVYGICGECNEPEGGFGKIYSAKWPEGHIEYWDIENQKWHRRCWDKYALKSLNNSSNISSDFLNEIKSHLQIHLNDVVPCYGITQNPNTKDRLLNFKNLPKPVNSSDLSSLQFNSDAKYAIQSTLANPISECFDVQLSESELNEICQDGENNIES
ncbi:unnamed protein product [Rhizophagus irregularis]|nr:unnamed protein product [Rhizophagus irregularis]